MKESTIEKKVCDYAKEKGWLCFKFMSLSNRGVPDRMFMKLGIVFFIEFKSPGKKPTKFQLLQINKIAQSGIMVFVCDDIDQGKQIIDNFKATHE